LVNFCQRFKPGRTWELSARAQLLGMPSSKGGISPVLPGTGVQRLPDGCVFSTQAGRVQSFPRGFVGRKQNGSVELNGVCILSTPSLS
jgi:hypothetical protein